MTARNTGNILHDGRAKIGYQPSIATSIGFVLGLIAVLQAYDGEPLLALAFFAVAVVCISISPLFRTKTTEVENEQ